MIMHGWASAIGPSLSHLLSSAQVLKGSPGSLQHKNTGNVVSISVIHSQSMKFQAQLGRIASKLSIIFAINHHFLSNFDVNCGLDEDITSKEAGTQVC